MTGLSLAVFLSLSAAAKGAPPPPDVDTQAAKKYFQWAQNLYKQARYAEAIGKFEEAYRLKPHPTIFFNIGRCYEQLGDINKALKNYREYLRIVPDAKDRELVTDAIANLERRLKEQGVQHLSVLSDPTGTRVSVDGKYVGLTPLAIELPPGNHRLTLAKDGYETVEKGFVLAADKSMELEVSLKMAAPAAPPPPPPVAAKPEPAKAEPAKSATLTPASSAVTKEGEQKPGFLSQRKIALAAGGGAVVAGVAGLIMGILADSSAKTLLGMQHDGAEAQRLHDQAKQMAMGANIAYAIAGVALVAAVVMFFVEPMLGGSKNKS